jgi:Aromatic-ring-opening dioxygenase LigAB, LigA subunit
MDKVIREFTRNADPQRVQRFREDPEAMLANRDLTDEEKRALIDVDMSTLYKLGAHPFILQGWMRLFDAGDPLTREERYIAAIRPHGYPDYGT